MQETGVIEDDPDIVSSKTGLKISKGDFILAKETPFSDDYYLKETLGEGAFGVVGKWENKKSGAIRAVKMLNRKDIPKNELKALANEIQIIKELDHPNIVKMYEEYEDQKYLYIVTELISGGELFDELLRKKKFTEVDWAAIIKQLLGALNYCHKNDIVHKDLKPENILLEKKKDINSIKLIDFGTAQKFRKGKKMTSIIGTPYYVAPEVLKGSYDEKWDIWGTGVIMFILLSGTPPFNGRDDETIMKNVLKGKYEFKKMKWTGISDEAKELISEMLIKDPADRISAEDALNHEWFDKVLSDDFESKKLTSAFKGLKKFKAKLKMQQAALGYIISQLATKEDTKDLDEAFQRIDTNHDGKLDLEELKEGCKEVYPEMTEEEVEKLFREADTDNSGSIDYTEWISATINKKKILTEENLERAFNAFDENGDGSISFKEIKLFLGHGKNINEKVWEEIIAEVDVDKNGSIEYEEFKQMMQKFID